MPGWDEPVFGVQGLVGKVVVGVDDKQVRDRLVTPLKPDVGIDVVDLVVVLRVGRQKHRLGERQIDFGADQKQVGPAVGSGQSDAVVGEVERDDAVGLVAIVQRGVQLRDAPIEVLTDSRRKLKENRFAHVRYVTEPVAEIPIPRSGG